MRGDGSLFNRAHQATLRNFRTTVPGTRFAWRLTLCRSDAMCRDFAPFLAGSRAPRPNRTVKSLCRGLNHGVFQIKALIQKICRSITLPRQSHRASGTAQNLSLRWPRKEPRITGLTIASILLYDVSQVKGKKVLEKSVQHQIPRD